MGGIGEYSVSDHGKPALSWFTPAAQLSWHDETCFRRHSFVCIRIHTGRNHQIRTHLFHSSHPTVVDGKYTCREVWLSCSPDAISGSFQKAAQLPPNPRDSAVRLPTLRRLPRSTSGSELRAAPGEDPGDGNR